MFCLVLTVLIEYHLHNVQRSVCRSYYCATEEIGALDKNTLPSVAEPCCPVSLLQFIKTQSCFNDDCVDTLWLVTSLKFFYGEIAIFFYIYYDNTLLL